jgi:hypothetical protein
VLGIDAAIGAGFVRASGHSVFAPSVLNVQVGVYAHRTTAIAARLASAMALHETVDGGVTVTNVRFVGPSVQVWPSDRWFVSAGAGWFDASTKDGMWSVRTQGHAIEGRLGYAFGAWTRHRLYAGLEVFSGGSTRHTSVITQLGWHVF